MTMSRVALDDIIATAREEAAAQAWDEGFDAGERDVFEHEATGWMDKPCIPNPYRKEQKNDREEG